METPHADQPYAGVRPRIRFDQMSQMLAYVVEHIEIRSDGIRAVRSEGLGEALGWSEVGALMARGLPDEAPFFGVPFLDIIPADGADTVALPLRVVPSTTIHFVDQGASLCLSSVATLRRLVLRAIAINPCIDMDTGTTAFARVGQVPRFEDSRAFLDYDARWL